LVLPIFQPTYFLENIVIGFVLTFLLFQDVGLLNSDYVPKNISGDSSSRKVNK